MSVTKYSGESCLASEESVNQLKEKVFRFKVQFKFKKRVYREMSLKGTSSLQEFARTIVEAFNFQFDHSYGFYSNLKDMYESDEAYTLFCDTGSKVMPNEKSVKNSYIYEVFKPGKKMMFLFDYGDEWEFLVECRGVIEAKDAEEYPKVTKTQGEAPPQYPDIEDNYESEEF